MTEKFHIVTDCDGIFTSANIQCDIDGKRCKLFSVNDSLTVDFILETYGDKIEIIVLTGDSGHGLEVTHKRLKYMGLDYVHCKNVFKYAYIKKNYQDLSKVFYIGDDIYDFMIMKEVVGLTVCNAPAIIQKHADYVSPFEGGKNALTDILFHILSRIGVDYETDLANYILKKQKEYDQSN